MPRIDRWDKAFGYLGEKLATETLVVVINEFPYLVNENASLSSYVQSFVDERLQDTESMLVLCGSSMSTMESEVLGHESPLYGRRTGQIDLQPFSFLEAREAIPYAFERQLDRTLLLVGHQCISRCLTTRNYFVRTSRRTSSHRRPFCITNRSFCCTPNSEIQPDI